MSELEYFKKCPNNHFYSEELDSCPECSIESTDISNKEENNSDAPEEPTFGESDDNSNENSQNTTNTRIIPTKKGYSWWRYDDEYISGWTYLGRSILGTILSFIGIGLYLNSTTAYKRAKSLGNDDTATLWAIWGFLVFFLSFTPLVVITNTIPHWYLWFSNGKNQSN